MTRQEFIDDVVTWEQLIRILEMEFRYFELTDDIYTYPQFEEELNEQIMWGNCGCWTDLRDCLNEIDDKSYWYLKGKYEFDWKGIDNDTALFEERKKMALKHFDNIEGFWESGELD